MKRERVVVTLHRSDLDEARIPRKFQSLGVNTYPANREALKQVQDYIRDYQRVYQKGLGMVVHGPRCGGKTFLITYALRMFLHFGRTVLYLTLDELTDSLMGGKSVLTVPLRAVLREVDFLAIDDIRPTHENDYSKGKRNAIEELISVRNDEGLPVIYGVGMSMVKNDSQGFAARFGKDVFEDLIDTTIQVRCFMRPNPKAKLIEERKKIVCQA